MADAHPLGLDNFSCPPIAIRTEVLITRDSEVDLVEKAQIAVLVQALRRNPAAPKEHENKDNKGGLKSDKDRQPWVSCATCLRADEPLKQMILIAYLCSSSSSLLDAYP